MNNNIEKRKVSFYEDKLDINKMDEVLNFVIETLTLKEILKMIRQISYDMVCYYDEQNCGIIYRDNKYSRKNIHQANRLQQSLRDICDLFGQSIIDHREFEDGYLEKYIDGGALQLEIQSLKDKITNLEEQIEELMERNGGCKNDM